MQKKTKYIIGASSMVVLGVASLLFFKNNPDFFTNLFKKWSPIDEGLGVDEANVGGTEQEILNTQEGTAILVGEVIMPFGGSANVRSSTYVNNDTGWTDFDDNLITTINSPDKIGTVQEIILPADNPVNIIEGVTATHTWYKVKLEETYWLGGLAWSDIGYVRADVVKKFI